MAVIFSPPKSKDGGSKIAILNLRISSSVLQYSHLLLRVGKSELLPPIHFFYDERKNMQQEECQPNHQHHRGDRPGNKNAVAARRHGERLAKTHLQHRRQYEPQYYWCGLEVKLAQHVSERAHRRHNADIDNAAVDRVDSENAKDKNRRIKHPVGNSQDIDEYSHERKI